MANKYKKHCDDLAKKENITSQQVWYILKSLDNASTLKYDATHRSEETIDPRYIVDRINVMPVEILHIIVKQPQQVGYIVTDDMDMHKSEKYAKLMIACDMIPEDIKYIVLTNSSDFSQNTAEVLLDFGCTILLDEINKGQHGDLFSEYHNNVPTKTILSYAPRSYNHVTYSGDNPLYREYSDYCNWLSCETNYAKDIEGTLVCSQLNVNKYVQNATDEKISIIDLANALTCNKYDLNFDRPQKPAKEMETWRSNMFRDVTLNIQPHEGMEKCLKVLKDCITIWEYVTRGTSLGFDFTNSCNRKSAQCIELVAEATGVSDIITAYIDHNIPIEDLLI